MELLYFFEKIRNPFCDFLFSTVTHLGDELVFMIAAILVFWCVDKRSGYYILISGFIGTLVNQAMKLICKVPRPWQRDLGFTIVESARERATGYSFPSGHSQNAATVFGSIFILTKKTWLKITALILAVLVLISRMYLGVHTPWDVLAGGATAVMILLLLEDVFKKEELFNKAMPWIITGLTVCVIGFYVYASISAKDSTNSNVLSALKNAGTLLGCSAGLILVYPLDRYVVKFDTKAPWYAQIIKVVLGFAIVLAIKSLLSSPLEALFGGFERVVRYFLIVAFAGAVWPMTFKYFAKMKISALDRFAERVMGIFKKNSESKK